MNFLRRIEPKASAYGFIESNLSHDELEALFNDVDANRTERSLLRLVNATQGITTKTIRDLACKSAPYRKRVLNEKLRHYGYQLICLPPAPALAAWSWFLIKDKDNE
ncbi:hypothetical protein [Vibrio parahaemolyticus]|uniref:hypothetical protein n=1 Tax=Vibrio parahaemolyticus TaxID=670 RepID=UPI00226BB087|nr:hypothetical protein [Vibrio parahaemolyticus]MCX8941274.1 hypothetical protein [Vibrio parahaemolyticus]